MVRARLAEALGDTVEARVSRIVTDPWHARIETVTDPEEHPLKADPFAQLKLLDVQELDARSDQLRHRLATLPEHADLAGRAGPGAGPRQPRASTPAPASRTSPPSRRRSTPTSRSVKARRTRDRDRMDQGLVTNPKDLERMQQELVSLERRISTLEDEEIEVMERLEEAQAELADFSQQAQAAREKGAALLASRDEQDGRDRGRAGRRSRPSARPAADGLPADLLALYDKLRASKDGVGAAALRARAVRRLPAEPGRRRAGRRSRPRPTTRCPVRGVPADPGADARVGAVTDPFRHQRVVIEADGGSRGNPGPAAYGAVLKDADTGEVIAEDGSTIGVATNNVAEYSGLIGGLQLAAELAPHAEIEVRMDSKLVVEQMSGRWKIKHPDMKPLALEANRLAPFGTTYTWMPREQNKHADRLANEALDGLRNGVTYYGAEPEERQGTVPGDEEPETAQEALAGAQAASGPAWASGAGRPTPTCGPRSCWSGTA